MSLTSPPGLHAAQTRATLRAIYIAPPSAVTPPPPSRRVERRERDAMSSAVMTTTSPTARASFRSTNEPPSPVPHEVQRRRLDRRARHGRPRRQHRRQTHAQTALRNLTPWSCGRGLPPAALRPFVTVDIRVPSKAVTHVSRLARLGTAGSGNGNVR